MKNIKLFLLKNNLGKVAVLVFLAVLNISLFISLNRLPYQRQEIFAQGLQCNFNQANCSWDALPGAASYNVKVTEVDTQRVVFEQTVSGNENKVVFNVIQNNTYECSVAAVNSCGQAGPTVSQSLLCSAEGLVGGPSPTPTASVSATPTPPPPALLCAQPGCSDTNPCEQGLTCVQAQDGQAYCAMPEAAQACIAAPGQTSCCSVPSTPTMEAPGISTDTAVIGAGILGVMIMGILMILVL